MITFLVGLVAVWIGLLLVSWIMAGTNRIEDPFHDFGTDESSPLVNTGMDHAALARNRTIFLVDDDACLLEVVAEVLRAHGFTVEGFTDPVKALAAFRAHHGKDDLLVTDYQMKPMTGMDLIAQCQSECPQLRSVIMSGVQDETELKDVPRGSSHFLAKPFQVKDLVTSIEKTLSESRN